MFTLTSKYREYSCGTVSPSGIKLLYDRNGDLSSVFWSCMFFCPYLKCLIINQLNPSVRWMVSHPNCIVPPTFQNGNPNCN